MLKLNAGDQKLYKKKKLSSLFGADTKICPSGSLFGITQQSLVMPNTHPQTDPHLTPMKDSYILTRGVR